MKPNYHIVLSTDFSERADNAFEYALHLAKFFQAKITILNAYHIPVMATVNDLPLQAGVFESHEADIEQKLEQIKQKAIEANVPCETVKAMGFAVDVIEAFLAKQQPDLVIMGARGGGKLDMVWGSTATAMIHKTTVPLLLIPENADFTGIYNIAFACDYTFAEENKSLKILKTLVEKFDGGVHILSVKQNNDTFKTEEAKVSVKLEEIFHKMRHSFHVEESKDVEEGIEKFVNENNIDMLVMLPHKKGFWEDVFQKSITKKMTFKTKVPIFILHENE